MSEQYITNAQMAHMRTLIAPIYMDTCKRLVYTAAAGDYGYGKPTYSAGSSSACLFVAKAKPDTQPGGDVPQTDADLYMPRDAAFKPDDRVMITHLHGEAVASPQTFAIVAGPIMDSVTMHAGLRLVTE